ncbi:MAG: extracellular solute-binding protein [Spirulina sp. SIO3F2]|nr:extracellular solute-binding protein [Spirulina sp. SIO3F2]
MLNRRSFLQAGGAIALSTLTTSCRGGSAETTQIYLLDRTLPLALVREFRNQRGISPNFRRETSLKAIAELLEQWRSDKKMTNRWSWVPIIGRKAKPRGHLVSLGDAWLSEAIRERWLQPIETEMLTQWPQLPTRWQNLMRRNNQGQLDPNGPVWGAPYRWGLTLIVYNQQVFQELGLAPPQDWADLWRPEFQGRIALVDQPREVIGLTLKSLGQSYNTSDLKAVPDLEPRLLTLQKNVRSYSSQHYLQPLLLKDAWIAVGWSNDILPALRNYGQLRAVVPKSGTALWVDLWAQPAAIAASPIAAQWIDFCWQPHAIQRISRFTDGLSPLLAADNEIPLSQDNIQTPLLQSGTEILTRSEFLEPLPSVTRKQYDTVWRRVRSALSTPTPE